MTDGEVALWSGTPRCVGWSCRSRSSPRGSSLPPEHRPPPPQSPWARATAPSPQVGCPPRRRPPSGRATPFRSGRVLGPLGKNPSWALVQVRLQGAQALFPERPVSLNPLRRRKQWVRVEGENMVSTPDRARHQAGRLQDPDVLGGRFKRYVEGGRELSDPHRFKP